MQIYVASDELRAQVAEIISDQMAETLHKKSADLTCEASTKTALLAANFGEPVVDLLWQEARRKAAAFDC